MSRREVARSVNTMADENDRLRGQEREHARLRALAREAGIRVRPSDIDAGFDPRRQQVRAVRFIGCKPPAVKGRNISSQCNLLPSCDCSKWPVCFTTALTNYCTCNCTCTAWVSPAGTISR